jgi:hypothetical protein
MGSVFEFNDTLKLRRGEGFPVDATVGSTHNFRIEGRRIYHLDPVRVFLVEEIDGLWNFVGQALILRETIDAEKNETSGEFRITKLYSCDYAAQLNLNDAPTGKGFPRVAASP